MENAKHREMESAFKRLFRGTDKVALVFMALGLFVIFETQRMNVGKVDDPGPGLFPLFLGIVILILSIVSIIKSMISKPAELSRPSGGLRSRNVNLLLGSLFFFILALPLLGFATTNFFMFVFLLKWVGKKKWFFTVGWSFFITATSYLVFGRWLLVLFPRGIVPF